MYNENLYLVISKVRGQIRYKYRVQPTVHIYETNNKKMLDRMIAFINSFHPGVISLFYPMNRDSPSFLPSFVSDAPIACLSAIRFPDLDEASECPDARTRRRNHHAFVVRTYVGPEGKNFLYIAFKLNTGSSISNATLRTYVMPQLVLSLTWDWFCWKVVCLTFFLLKY